MTKQLALEYNSSREHIIFNEYGRIIQKLVTHTKTLEDKEERQAAVEYIIELIYLLNPQTKNIHEFKQKLWRHIFKLANYELDVDHPYGPLPTEEDNVIIPDRVPYPQHEFKWRHYGYNIRVMIDKALAMEDGVIKQGFVETILSYMKLSYRTWNKEHFVSDDIIISDLSVMSGNKLSVNDDHTIQVITKSNSPNAMENTFKPAKRMKQTRVVQPQQQNKKKVLLNKKPRKK